MLREQSSHVELRSSMFGHLVPHGEVVRGVLVVVQEVFLFSLGMITSVKIEELIAECGMERTVKAPAVSSMIHLSFVRVSLSLQLMILK